MFVLRPGLTAPAPGSQDFEEELLDALCTPLTEEEITDHERWMANFMAMGKRRPELFDKPPKRVRKVELTSVDDEGNL
jgi:hypothetical protein